MNPCHLKKIDKKNYYEKSFALGIPQLNLTKLKDKIFGIENNLDELNGIDFKKGCYIGQENTSRIKLRNKLRRRILPIKKISGKFSENDIIKYKEHEVGKIMINEPYPFALIKVVNPNLKEFIIYSNIENIWINLQSSSPTENHFIQQFHRWFDGLKTIRLLKHFT